MDVFAHGLYGGAFSRIIKPKTSFWIAVLFGVLPDVISFGPHFINSFILNGSSFNVPVFNIPSYVNNLYNITHSLILAILLSFTVWRFLPKYKLEFLAWPLHVLFDIPTHTNFYTTPFLWPISNIKIHGISWGQTWFMILNYIAISIIFLVLLKYRRVSWKFLIIPVLVGVVWISLFTLRKPETLNLNLDGKIYILRTAKTPWEKAQGLSKIREAKEYDGMIFYFDPPEQATFWNKNTYLDLELIWINNKQIIGRDELPSITHRGLVTKTSPGKITEVIEIIKQSRIHFTY
ncbi:MAG: DUF192 domain-containing protein [Parcubacteria group bacterium]|nr:DUF192 domain-containing protein [Parcubacteria group bacterium]